MGVSNLINKAWRGKKPCKFSLFELINLPWKRTFLLFLCGSWHKNLCPRHKVNIKRGKQRKLMWFTHHETPKIFPVFSVKNNVFGYFFVHVVGPGIEIQCNNLSLERELCIQLVRNISCSALRSAILFSQCLFSKIVSLIAVMFFFS